MYQNRLFHPLQILEHTFNLIDTYPFFLNNSICPTFYLYVECIKFHHPAQRNLRMIRDPHPFLNLAVKLCSHLHSILVLRCYSIVNISAPKDEFHQITD